MAKLDAESRERIVKIDIENAVDALFKIAEDHGRRESGARSSHQAFERAVKKPGYKSEGTSYDRLREAGQKVRTETFDQLTRKVTALVRGVEFLHTHDNGRPDVEMTRERAKELIDTYGKAWMTRDPDLILTIFTEDATYNDPSLPENQGHAGIRAYWVSKVIGEQADIDFHPKNIWVNGDNVIAEWDAAFTDTKRKLRIEMTEVAIFTVKGGKFGSLREYYKTVKTPLE